MPTKFLKEADFATARQIDKDGGVTNCWNSKWMEEKISHDFPNLPAVQYKLGDCIKKTDTPGGAWCIWCDCDDTLGLIYGGDGKGKD